MIFDALLDLIFPMSVRNILPILNLIEWHCIVEKIIVKSFFFSISSVMQSLIFGKIIISRCKIFCSSEFYHRKHFFYQPMPQTLYFGFYNIQNNVILLVNALAMNCYHDMNMNDMQLFATAKMEKM